MGEVAAFLRDAAMLTMQEWVLREDVSTIPQVIAPTNTEVRDSCDSWVTVLPNLLPSNAARFLHHVTTIPLSVNLQGVPKVRSSYFMRHNF